MGQPGSVFAVRVSPETLISFQSCFVAVTSLPLGQDLQIFDSSAARFCPNILHHTCVLQNRSGQKPASMGLL